MKTWTVDDVMTTEVVSVEPAASYRQLVDLLIAHRLSAVPVVDDTRRVIGIVSEADLLRKIEYAGDEEPRMFDAPRRRADRAKAAAGTAAELMSAPPVVVRCGSTIAAAARHLDKKRVKRLPVVDDDNRLAGIVTRGDLLKIHLRTDDEILLDVQAGVLDALLADEADAITLTVQDGIVTVAGKTDRRSAADLAIRLIRQVPGVIDVISRLEYSFDDTELTAPSWLYGVP